MSTKTDGKTTDNKLAALENTLWQRLRTTPDLHDCFDQARLQSDCETLEPLWRAVVGRVITDAEREDCLAALYLFRRMVGEGERDAFGHAIQVALSQSLYRLQSSLVKPITDFADQQTSQTVLQELNALKDMVRARPVWFACDLRQIGLGLLLGALGLALVFFTLGFFVGQRQIAENTCEFGQKAFSTLVARSPRANLQPLESEFNEEMRQSVEKDMSVYPRELIRSLPLAVSVALVYVLTVIVCTALLQRFLHWQRQMIGETDIK